MDQDPLVSRVASRFSQAGTEQERLREIYFEQYQGVIRKARALQSSVEALQMEINLFGGDLKKAFGSTHALGRNDLPRVKHALKGASDGYADAQKRVGDLGRDLGSIEAFLATGV